MFKPCLINKMVHMTDGLAATRRTGGNRHERVRARFLSEEKTANHLRRVCTWRALPCVLVRMHPEMKAPPAGGMSRCKCWMLDWMCWKKTCKFIGQILKIHFKYAREQAGKIHTHTYLHECVCVCVCCTQRAWRQRHPA